MQESSVELKDHRTAFFFKRTGGEDDAAAPLCVAEPQCTARELRWERRIADDGFPKNVRDERGPCAWEEI